MSKKSLFKVLTETGPLIALGTALRFCSVAGPASAQFFNFGGFGGRRSARLAAAANGGLAAAGSAATSSRRSSSNSRKQPRQDFSRAPPPDKRDTIPDATCW